VRVLADLGLGVVEAQPQSTGRQRLIRIVGRRPCERRDPVRALSTLRPLGIERRVFA
jgi:hypothetical protein